MSILRSHTALYIDAGYLLAAAATRLTGSSFRHSVDVDFGRLLNDLIDLVEKRTGLPILRVYWYDAARDGIATPAQERIALLPKVKLRLGRIGVEGEQKGVDLRIGLDMVGHSRNGAVATMYLLSGDDDLTEAVEEAQSQGVQVIVLAVPSKTGERHGVSRHLMLAADELEIIDADLLDSSVSGVSPQGTPSTTEDEDSTPTTQASPADVARQAPARTIPLL
ncbi:NYN domain-containing protein, partial [Yonghaparkia sp. Soil809]|uniref:NYN domain-containing protein n=1 Tax=Yonghaparkia sp. Soil809 TaxID=1736417 RepID=UPI0019105DEA